MVTTPTFCRCSAPCGGGYMMVHAVCRNNGTSAEVDPDMCDPAAKPRSRMAACNSKPCPARWGHALDNLVNLK